MTEIVNMDKIAELVRAKGVPCYVEMTGGGVATIYAGESFQGHGWSNTELDTMYPVLAGPGGFNSPEYGFSVGYLHDFYIGPDGDVDEFDTMTTDDDEQTIADAIVAMVPKYSITNNRGE